MLEVTYWSWLMEGPDGNHTIELTPKMLFLERYGEREVTKEEAYPKCQ